MKLPLSSLLRSTAAASCVAALLCAPLGACDSSGSTPGATVDAAAADTAGTDAAAQGDVGQADGLAEDAAGGQDTAEADAGGEDTATSDTATSDTATQPDAMMGDMHGDTGMMPDGGPMGPTWTTDIQPMMQSYCTSCHGFASSYMSFQFQANKSYKKMKAGSMPPGCQGHGPGCPTTDEIATLKAWLDAGKPE